MSCTHDCGCTPEIRDARTDEWVQIAPESARAATLTPEQGAEALPDVRPPASPQKPVLPRRIAPEDVRVGMVVERRRGECYVGGRVQSIDGSCIKLGASVVAWTFGGIFGDYGWSLWLIEDAPAPVDPDAEPTDADTEDAVYLSGPMTGLPDFNRPAFHAAAAALRAQGYVVINPAEVDLGPDATWLDYMRVHLAEIARRVTQVFVLPGWESSRGAQLEVHVARSLGLPVKHHYPCPHCGERLAIGADRCHGCWKRVG